MVDLAIQLNDEQVARLEEIARARGGAAEDVVGEAIDRYLEHDREFRAAVLEGVSEAGRGEADEFDVYAADLRARMARATSADR